MKKVLIRYATEEQIEELIDYVQSKYRNKPLTRNMIGGFKGKDDWVGKGICAILLTKFGIKCYYNTLAKFKADGRLDINIMRNQQ